VSALTSNHRGLVALLVLSGVLAIPLGTAWGQSVAGQATAATVNTPAAGSRTSEACPPAGLPTARRWQSLGERPG